MSTWREKVLLVSRTDPDGGLWGRGREFTSRKLIGLLCMLIPYAYETTLGLWPRESLGVRHQQPFSGRPAALGLYLWGLCPYTPSRHRKYSLGVAYVVWGFSIRSVRSISIPQIFSGVASVFQTLQTFTNITFKLFPTFFPCHFAAQFAVLNLSCWKLSEATFAAEHGSLFCHYLASYC